MNTHNSDSIIGDTEPHLFYYILHQNIYLLSHLSIPIYLAVLTSKRCYVLFIVLYLIGSSITNIPIFITGDFKSGLLIKVMSPR